jgi:hypothetical protein
MNLDANADQVLALMLHGGMESDGKDFIRIGCCLPPSHW